MLSSENTLYLCKQIKVCEQHAYSTYHWDENKLISQAGTEAFFLLRELYTQVRHIAVFCGIGENAGYGYVLARLAQEHGISVSIYHCQNLEDLSASNKILALAALGSGALLHLVDEFLDIEAELIVDALWGIESKKFTHELIITAITQINASGLPIISLDIPSGLHADTGQADNFCIKAAKTITFIAHKAGMYTLDGPDYCGDIHYLPLQLQTCIAKITPYAFLLDNTTLSLPLPLRKKNSHKGCYGTVLVIGGGPGMPGAVGLVAKAAMRIGAGAVHIATWPAHAYSILPFIPEAMIWKIKHADELKPLLAQATVCVIGPGLGQSDWAQTLFLAAITSQIPMVIDASALRLLAEYAQLDDNWILTPHPGEAASLLACPIAEIQKDRYLAAASIQQQYGGTVVLKGVGTIIQTVEKNTFVCNKGNAGMASAGMGDVLSGIIAGFCAQGLSLSEAAKLGVWVHARAGDKQASILGGTGLLASDLLDILPKILNNIYYE